MCENNANKAVEDKLNTILPDNTLLNKEKLNQI